MKSIYDEALCTVTEALEQPDNSVIFRHNGLNELKKLLEQARKQEKLLELYEELTAVKDDMLSCCEVRDLDYFDIIDMQFDLEQQIGEVE